MSDFNRIFSLEPKYKDHRLLEKILNFLQVQDKEELFFAFGQPFFTRYAGVLQRVSFFEEELSTGSTREDQKEIIAELMSKFKEERPNFYPDLVKGAIEFSFILSDKRLRTRIESYNDDTGIFVYLKVFRGFPFALKGLGFPDEIISKLVGMTKGIIIITGAPSSGRTSTALSLVQEITAYKRVIAVCYEKPIEIPISSSKSIIIQKSYGTDFSSWSELRYEKKSPASVVYISDVQSREAAEAALDLATSGKLVIITTSGTSSISTLLTLETLFLPQEHQVRRNQLSLSFQAIIYQDLLQRKDSQNPFALSFEVIFSSPKLKVLLSEGKYSMIASELQAKGNIPYNLSLKQLFQRGIISEKIYKREVVKYNRGYVTVPIAEV